MTSAYPGSLDSFNNPTGTTKTDATGYEHATQHANANDAIEAIQAELGTTPSGSYATVKARLEAGVSGSIQGAWDSSTAYVVGDIVTHNGMTWAAIDDSTDVEPTTDSGITTRFDADDYFVTSGDWGPLIYLNYDTPGTTTSFDTVDVWFVQNSTDTDLVIKQGGVTLATGTFPAGVGAGWRTATLSARITPVDSDDIQWEFDRTASGNFTIQYAGARGRRGVFTGTTEYWVVNSDIGGSSYWMIRKRLRDTTTAIPAWEALTSAPSAGSFADLADVDVASASTGDMLYLAAAPTAGWLWVGLPDTITGSGYYTNSYDPNAWDNSDSTSWNTGATEPAWTKADFGSPITASRVGLHSASVAKYWTLEVSDDNSNWTMLAEFMYATVNASETLYGFPETTARYWRFTASDGDWTDPYGFTLYTYVVDEGPKWSPLTPVADGLPTGGTTGQLLAKDTNTDYDVEWVDSYSAPVRDTEVYTTASLDDDAEETGTVTLAKGYRLLRIETDVPARVRVYTTAAKRTADASRPIGTDPTGDHGVVLDFVTTGSLLAADLSPTVDGWQNESTPGSSVPIAVQNLSGATDTVAVTFTYIQTEA